MVRPPHPSYELPPAFDRAPLGFEWVAVPGDGWTLSRPARKDGKPAADRCRYGRPAHGAPAVAWLFRPVWSSKDGRPWAYCAAHLFGRWIENGQVWMWNVMAIAP